MSFCRKLTLPSRPDFLAPQALRSGFSWCLRSRVRPGFGTAKVGARQRVRTGRRANRRHFGSGPIGRRRRRRNDRARHLHGRAGFFRLRDEQHPQQATTGLVRPSQTRGVRHNVELAKRNSKRTVYVSNRAQKNLPREAVFRIARRPAGETSANSIAVRSKGFRGEDRTCD